MLGDIGSGFIGTASVIAASVMTFLVLRLVVGRVEGLAAGGLQVEFTKNVQDLESAVAKADRAAQRPSDVVDRNALAELQTTYGGINDRLDRIERQSRILDTRRLALLQTYHNQGLAQSKMSFWFSLILATAGFIIIASAAATAQSSTNSGTSLTVVAGAVTEAVSALFFAQSNRARRLMQDFFDRLSDDQRREEALSLANDIDNVQLRDALKAVMSLRLVNSEVAPSVLPGFSDESGLLDQQRSVSEK